MNSYFVGVVEFGFNWNPISNIRSGNVEKRSKFQTPLFVDLTDCELRELLQEGVTSWKWFTEQFLQHCSLILRKDSKLTSLLMLLVRKRHNRYQR